jgi:hypothetical protein
VGVSRRWDVSEKVQPDELTLLASAYENDAVQDSSTDATTKPTIARMMPVTTHSQSINSEV